jgi:hypothetical protein
LRGCPGHPVRIDALIFHHSYKEPTEDAVRKTKGYLKLMKDLRTNPKLKLMLEVILAVGNYLNGTSARGGAYGFDVDTLQKLSDLRAQDGKSTLLDYLVAFCDKKKPELLTIRAEFPLLEELSKCNH